MFSVPHRLTAPAAWQGIAKLGLIGLLAALLPACSSLGFAGAVGPSNGAIRNAATEASVEGITVLPLTSAMGQQMHTGRQGPAFADALGGALPVGSVVGNGDVLEVTIWEAPPAALFGTSYGDIRSTTAAAGTQTSRSTTLPELLVGLSGRVTIPFAGSVPVAGRTTTDIEADITRRLVGQAHLPQVQVRIARNTTATATIVGDVVNSQRLPLTSKGERLLDAIAQAGGVRQDVGKMTVQVSRGGQIYTMPLKAVIDDPRQNVVLATGDIVTLQFQPFSFSVLGATGRNDEIAFEGVGLTLAQALGRIGGLQNERANPNGVFVFRWERPELVGVVPGSTPARADGRIPVIYRADLRDPGTFFAAQNFDIADKDVIYVSNAPLADFQRFVGIVSQTILPIVAVEQSIRR